MEVEQYLNHVKIQDGTSTTWAIKPEVDSMVDLNLYSGISGIILFYLELYHSTGDTRYLDEATAGANALLNEEVSAAIPSYLLGMYTGAAGKAYTLEEVFQTTNNQDYLNKAFQWMKAIKDQLDGVEEDQRFGGYTDIIYGAAGIGLVSLHFLEHYQEQWLDELLVSCADFLIGAAQYSAGSVRWKLGSNVPYFMDNFSHGAAGNAYFLLKAYNHTGDDRYLEIAQKAADYLLSSTNEQGLVCHHDPGGEGLHYLGYCHGPPGTSRLFYAMYELTEDVKWMKAIRKSANYMIDMDLHENRTPGLWNNEGWCCGTVGICSYLSHSVYDHPETFERSIKLMEERIYNEAINDQNGIRWLHAENRRSPDELFIQTGLMQGSAGFGLYYVRRHLSENDKKWSIVLPDEIGN
jgi:lantibiotic modifying enzyme